MTGARRVATTFAAAAAVDIVFVRDWDCVIPCVTTGGALALTNSCGRLAAASSADFLIARLVCAVTVAGRKLGAADDDVAGVLSVAGACFLAGVAVFAGALGTASARETCLWAEDDDVSFLVEEEDFLWDEWVVVAAVVDACAAFLTGVAAVVLAVVEA